MKEAPYFHNFHIEKIQFITVLFIHMHWLYLNQKSIYVGTWPQLKTNRKEIAQVPSLNFIFDVDENIK